MRDCGESPAKPDAPRWLPRCLARSTEAQGARDRSKRGRTGAVDEKEQHHPKLWLARPRAASILPRSTSGGLRPLSRVRRFGLLGHGPCATPVVCEGTIAQTLRDKNSLSARRSGGPKGGCVIRCALQPPAMTLADKIIFPAPAQWPSPLPHWDMHSPPIGVLRQARRRECPRCGGRCAQRVVPDDDGPGQSVFVYAPSLPQKMSAAAPISFFLDDTLPELEEAAKKSQQGSALCFSRRSTSSASEGRSPKARSIVPPSRGPIDTPRTTGASTQRSKRSKKHRRRPERYRQAHEISRGSRHAARQLDANREPLHGTHRHALEEKEARRSHAQHERTLLEERAVGDFILAKGICWRSSSSK